MIRYIGSLAIALGSTYLFFQAQGLNRWVTVAVGASGIYYCYLSIAKKRNDSCISLEKPPEISSQRERNYRFSWNMEDSEIVTEYSGTGRAFDFGDRIIFFQTDVNTAGTYIMDLKTSGKSVSGVWWYIGGALPQGTYRGQLSTDGITGVWQSPDGSKSGDWNFTMIREDVPSENS